MSSNRRAAFDAPDKNPAERFLEWKSNDKCFQYYDRETKENVQVPLPFKFLVLDEMHKISGWNDATSSSIFSNEVKFIGKETMTVKPYKGNEIAKGLYKDIKEKVKSCGGYYMKSIYIMLEDGTLANLSLKGSSVQQWGDFTQKTRKRLVDEWVIVEKHIDGKKGSVKYTMPDFKFNTSLSSEDGELADIAFNTFEGYMKTYLQRAEPLDESEHDENDSKDDLDF